eukprot:6179220-Pleurochrysis_carterae.AAC.2
MSCESFLPKAASASSERKPTSSSYATDCFHRARDRWSTMRLCSAGAPGITVLGGFVLRGGRACGKLGIAVVSAGAAGGAAGGGAAIVACSGAWRRG